jgi:hypothetical protein
LLQMAQGLPKDGRGQQPAGQQQQQTFHDAWGKE